MSAFEQLPPDQRATISLLLRRRKSYAEVAAILDVEQRAVHDRAHAGLAVLAPSLARGVRQELREQIGDYLLGQQEPRDAERTRARIAASTAARRWAKALAVELVHVTADQLPEIPDEPRATADPPREAPDEPRATADPPREAPDEPRATADQPLRAEAHAERDDSEPPPTGGAVGPQISRRGGLAVLGAIAVVVIVAIVLVVSSGKGRGASGGRQAAQTPASEAGSGGSGEGGTGGEAGGAEGSKPKPHVESEALLSAPNGGKATGGVIFASEKGKRVFILAAEHLEPTSGFKYVAWLVGAKGEAVPLGIAQVSSEGKIAAANLLPEHSPSSGHFELTRNHGAKPSQPGQVVLEGSYAPKG
ncbi:MAG: RNA polymerase sigma factor [Solirubrobacteraceae bacterium]